MKEISMKQKLMEKFNQARILVRGKLRGKRTDEKKSVETMVFLAKTFQMIDSLVIEEDGTTKRRSMSDVYRICLDKCDAGAAKYGNFEPLNDKRNLLREAQNELIDAINYMAMALIKIDARREAGLLEEAEDDRFSLAKWLEDTEAGLDASAERIALEEAHGVPVPENVIEFPTADNEVAGTNCSQIVAGMDI